MQSGTLCSDRSALDKKTKITERHEWNLQIEFEEIINIGGEYDYASRPYILIELH